MYLTLHRKNGTPVRHLKVDRETLTPSTTKTTPKTRHHILVVDRSGSMWGVMDEMRLTIKKLLTVHEYQDPSMLITLISYSSKGDCTVHVNRASIQAIQKAGSPEQRAIDQLRPTGLTCISQGLERAVASIRDGEQTVITLHSDGYANDVSPFAERNLLETLCKKIAVPVNTIAYSSYSDFSLLNLVSAKTGGKCVLAESLAKVYDALLETMDALQQGGPTRTIEIGTSHMVVAYDSKKIVSAIGQDLKLFGMGDDTTILRLTKVDTQPADDALSPSECLVVAHAMLAQGNLMGAKGALIASRDATLYPHYTALLPHDLGIWASAMETAIFNKMAGQQILNTPGVQEDGATVVQIGEALARHASHVKIHLPSLLAKYKRRGIKKVAGTWTDGKLEEFPYDEVATDDGEWVSLGTVEVATTRPNMNIQIRRPCNLVQKKGGLVISKIAGIDLTGKLTSFRSYTIVGDGKVLVDSLKIKVSSKALWSDLKGLGVVTNAYDPNAEIDIQLAGRSVVEEMETISIPARLFESIAKLQTLISLISALQKGTSVDYSAEQVQALKEHGLSPSLGLNFPTTVPYQDQKEAIAKGEIDSYTAYSIALGSEDIISLQALNSANEAFDRFYVVEGEKKAKLTMVAGGKAFSAKKLSARTTITKVDELQRPILDAFLGHGSAKNLADIATLADLDEEDLENLTTWTTAMEEDERVAAFKVILKKLQDTKDALEAAHLTPLGFAVGSTGTVPDTDGTIQAYGAEDLGKRFPNLKISKSQAEGTFFVVPSVDDKGETSHHILGVFPQECKFSI